MVVDTRRAVLIPKEEIIRKVADPVGSPYNRVARAVSTAAPKEMLVETRAQVAMPNPARPLALLVRRPAPAADFLAAGSDGVRVPPRRKGVAQALVPPPIWGP
jgi:hypothetical protein